MSASTDLSTGRTKFPDAWRPAGILYLAFMLLGLAAGLWHDGIFPPHVLPRPAPLPVLQSLAVAQTLFVVFAYPVVLMARAAGRPDRADWLSTLAESALHMLIAAVFYIPGAFLADAVVLDAIRAGLHVLALYPLAWVAGSLSAKRPAWRPGLQLATMVIALGLPMAYYVALEFFPPQVGRTLRDLTPAVLAWNNASPRLGLLVPHPIWAWLIWPLLGLVGGFVGSRASALPACSSDDKGAKV